MLRPPFREALAYWRSLIDDRGLSAHLRWVFRENLCLEPAVRGETVFRVSFQTFSGAPSEADVERAYETLVRARSPVVFEALVQERDFTLCTLLGDVWESDDDVHREDWDLYFKLSDPYRDHQEIRDAREWKRRKRRENRSPSGLDFVVSGVEP